MPFWKFSLLKKIISFTTFAFRWLKRKLTLLFCKSIIQVIEQVCNFCFAFDNTFPSNEIYVWKSLKIKADVSWETITVLERQEFWIWRWEVFSRTPNFPKSEKSFDLSFLCIKFYHFWRPLMRTEFDQMTKIISWHFWVDHSIFSVEIRVFVNLRIPRKTRGIFCSRTHIHIPHFSLEWKIIWKSQQYFDSFPDNLGVGLVADRHKALFRHCTSTWQVECGW